MKNALKTIGLEFIYLLICAAAASACAAIQLIGRMETSASTSFMFVTAGYKYNYFCYLIGLIIFVGAVALIYNRFFKGIFDQLRDQSTGVKIAFVVTSVIGALASLAGIAFTSFCFLGLTDIMKPEALSFITCYIWPVFILLYTLFAGFKAKKHN